jgi:hypothetical protein
MDYEPKRIIMPEWYDEYELMLHRELASYAKNLDSPNPFRKAITETIGIKIVLNDTNDLPFVVKHFEEKIDDGIEETVIIGDPAPLGYSLEVLDRLNDESKYSSRYIRNKEWIIYMINIDEHKDLYIEDGKFQIR